jgi:hypothetical protein
MQARTIRYRSNTQEPISFIMHHHQIKDVITLDLMIHKDMQHHAW